MKTNMKILALAMLIPLTTGCNKTPSDADIKNSIAKAFEQCPLIEVTNFKKKNGFINEEDGYYNVSVEFTLHVIPPEESIAFVKQKQEQLPKLYEQNEEFRAKYSAIMKERFAIEKQQSALFSKYHEEYLNKLKRELEEETQSSEITQEDFVISRSKYDKGVINASVVVSEIMKTNHEYLSLNDKINSLNQEIELLNKESPEKKIHMYEKSVHVLQGTFFKHCKIPKVDYAMSLIGQLFPIRADEGVQFATEFTNDFKSEFEMIKTDNGWVMKEFYDL